MTVQIHVNGERFELPRAGTVADLLESLDLRPEQVAVEVNELLVPRGRRSDTTLQVGDRVEFVTLVGGG
ncbi:MAG: sulfur carrier protein [Chlamydiales bacterium]|jgi:sulfur carrier protein